jgi:hypothetical protein
MINITERPPKLVFTKADALIIQHCAVMGRRETQVRAYHVGAVKPYAQYPCSVWLAYIKPRKRLTSSRQIVPDNITYFTIEVAGQVVYDSRADVPCDMGKWEATNTEFTHNRPFTVIDRAPMVHP